MTLAHGGESVACLLHPPGPPDFNRQHWLSFEEAKADGVVKNIFFPEYTSEYAGGKAFVTCRWILGLG